MAATVSISIVGRPYDIVCDDGQQDTIRALAAEVDRRAVEVMRRVGTVADTKLMVMVALLLADELGELRRTGRTPAAAPVAPAPDDAEADDNLAEGIADFARRIEAIAQRLESA